MMPKSSRLDVRQSNVNTVKLGLLNLSSQGASRSRQRRTIEALHRSVAGQEVVTRLNHPKRLALLSKGSKERKETYVHGIIGVAQLRDYLNRRLSGVLHGNGGVVVPKVGP